MEDNSSQNDGGENEAVDERFDNFCTNGLQLDENTYAQAMMLFRKTKHIMFSNISSIGNGTPEEAEKFWFAFVSYSVKRMSEKNTRHMHRRINAGGLNLCQILRIAKLNIVEFFKELPHFVVKASPILSDLFGVEWEIKLEAKEMQANFVHLSILSRHYKRAYRELFSLSDVSIDKGLAVSNCKAYASDCYRFGWLLFLALRVHAFSRFRDLVTCTNGLVSVLAILIIHIPIQIRKFSFVECQWFVKKSDKNVDLFASLCNKYDTSEDELRKAMEKTSGLIVDILKKKFCLASEHNNNPNLAYVNTDGLVYFEDLMEESSLRSSLNILEKDYSDAISDNGELDERVFINEEDSLLASGSLSGGSICSSNTKRKFDSMSSPIKSVTSPFSCHGDGSAGGANPKMVPPTPVRTAMTTAKWLRTVISPLPCEPSPALQSLVASCEPDIAMHDLIRRARIITGAIFPTTALAENCTAGINMMDNIWAEQRRLEALKLYYKVLESICVAEAQILHVGNLAYLLANERFHRCMLACSAELVLATHKTVSMLFPAVLERTGITAFDLSKVIESFVRHEESLPRELKRHLNSLEEKLLESMVWERGSSMYNSLVVAKPAHSSDIIHLGLLPQPMPTLDAIAARVNFSGHPHAATVPSSVCDFLGQNSLMHSPKRPRNPSFASSPLKDLRPSLSGNFKSKLLPPLQSAFASPTRKIPGGGGETCGDTSINIFFSKISKLAAVRINSMIERLEYSHQHIRDNVYHLFHEILLKKTNIFFNRHIDQLILCCLYGVAKISKLNLTFREIVCNYRKQPQCKSQVFRSVLVDWSLTSHNRRTGQEHVDIITFYNEVFIPAAKSFLVEIGSSATAAPPPPPPPPPPPFGNQVPEVCCPIPNPGQGPASPRTSSFPNLPDMSPKKVSAAHNVYVSPLRSSKMDALISHSSKSYYACVGESTRAYQSPSKDLTAINDRLNSSCKKIRGPLKFDDVDPGLVSDAMVVSTLHPDGDHQAT